MGRARVVLVRPSARWSAAFVAAVRRSRRLHGRWVKAPSTPAAYRAYVGRLRRTTHEGYLICLCDSDELVGVANISEIVRGPCGAAISATTCSGNHASIRLARRLGFRREGYSPRYLKIQGRWRDHERWALLAARP